MSIKLLPRWVYQAVALLVFVLDVGLTAYWGINNSGLYALINRQFKFLGDLLWESLAAALLTFFALFFAGLFVLLILGRFTRNWGGAKDEEYLSEESPAKNPLDGPIYKTRFTGIASILAGLVFLIIDLIVWNASGKGVTRLWVAVPVAILLGCTMLIKVARMKAE